QYENHGAQASFVEHEPFLHGGLNFRSDYSVPCPFNRARPRDDGAGTLGHGINRVKGELCLHDRNRIVQRSGSTVTRRERYLLTSKIGGPPDHGAALGDIRLRRCPSSLGSAM